MIIGIDPGTTKGIGFSRFAYATSALQYAALCTLDEAIALLRGCSRDYGDVVVIEVPRIYGPAQRKGDLNDLLDLAVVVGRLQQAALSSGATVELVTPHAWKGSALNKADFIKQRIEPAVSKDERDRVEWPSTKALCADVWDAIGIGLWKLGRLNPKKVFPR